MEVLEAISTALASIITLFILGKLMGNREISQMTMFDYINGITIGSIAAEMATAMFTDVVKPFTAMIVYASVIILISRINERSVKIRRMLTGKALVLYDNGELFKSNLRKAKMDLGEFLAECRAGGYFDLSKLQTIILEANGKLSFLPLADEKPITCKDMNIKPQQEMMVANVIIDGKLMLSNLSHTGNNEKWLMNQLKAHGVNEVSEVFLATCDVNNKVNVYKKTTEKFQVDILE